MKGYTELQEFSSELGLGEIHCYKLNLDYVHTYTLLYTPRLIILVLMYNVLGSLSHTGNDIVEGCGASTPA